MSIGRIAKSVSGVYFVKDTKFASLFPNYELCKIGYSYNLRDRLSQFPNYDDLELVAHRHFSKSTSVTELEEYESKWASEQGDKLGYPFWNKYTINPKFKFPKKFDDTTKLLKKLYGNDYFDGASKLTLSQTNKMFRYFHNMKRRRVGASNWGSTEWFVIKSRIRGN